MTTEAVPTEEENMVVIATWHEFEPTSNYL